MEWLYDIVRVLWSGDNMYVTVALVTFMIGVLHSMNQGG